MNKTQKIQRVIDTLPLYKKEKGTLGTRYGNGECHACVMGVIALMYLEESGDSETVFWVPDLEKDKLVVRFTHKNGKEMLSYSDSRVSDNIVDFSGLSKTELGQLRNANDNPRSSANWEQELKLLKFFRDQPLDPT